LILPEYLARINGNRLFLALIFEKIIEIEKYYDWESIFRGSLNIFFEIMLIYLYRYYTKIYDEKQYLN
ncbi:MAG TPA: hypothetical protein H9685_03555, partial [Firmicutes bacterium]|nr:hypothetical protein [Bacillota bacterium]